MADSITLTDWLLSQSQKIDFKVTEYKWVNEYAPAYSDFGVSFLKGEIVGRAADKNANLALAKAIGEGIERVTCIHNNIKSSVGLAAHPILEDAISNAKTELIERISFDLHFSNQMSFQKVKSLTAEAKSVTTKLMLLGIHLSFYEMLAPEKLKAICAVATGANFQKGFGGIMGLGCHEDVVQAERSALFESLRNVVSFIDDPKLKSLSVAEFLKINDPRFIDRYRLSLGQNYFNELKFLFSNATTFPQKFPELEFETRKLALPSEFSTAPIFVVQVTSNYEFKKADGPMPSPVG